MTKSRDLPRRVGALEGALGSADAAPSQEIRRALAAHRASKPLTKFSPAARRFVERVQMALREIDERMPGKPDAPSTPSAPEPPPPPARRTDWSAEGRPKEE
jgi:hypothetical protein